MSDRSGPVVTPARVGAAVCVIAPFVATLWVSSYNKKSPELGGMPFFYWYQLLWVVITAVLMAVAYFLIKYDREQRRGGDE
jgi:F0F1-type ATP synthase assembly protein I